ncbi:MAG: OmpH family outer membrane protein [Akkermansiaceae bacterium]|nr:OmpH family outer membrane protein [Akkermansiaceae bacterium]NNM29950.1 OmpH family outer membrane protein [Akkermansiaceae bacterium]
MKAFIFFISLFVAIPAAAEDLRIAVVDMTRLFNTHPHTAAAEKRVDEARAKARTEFLEKSKALKFALQAHQDLLLAGKSTEAGKKLETARALQRELAADKTTRENDLQKQFLDEKRTILKNVREAVQAYNNEEGYALVLDRSAAAGSGIPMVVDVEGLDDITDAVIARFKK